VQVLQAANTGITSLQSLVASAQSVANQVLQTPIGYSSKSSIASTAISGATANNLLGASAPTNAVATGTSAITPIDLTGTLATNASAAATSALSTINLNDTAATNATETGTNTIATTGAGIDATGGLAFDINGQTVTLAAGSGTGTGGTYLASDIASQINTQVGTSASVHATVDVAGHLTLTSTGTASSTDAIALSNFTGTGFDGTALGFSSATPATVNGTNLVPHANLTFDVNGTTVTLAHGSSYTGAQVASAINSAVTGVNASYASGKLVINSTGTAGASDSVTVGTFSTGDATSLGFATASVTANGAAAVPAADLTFKVDGDTVTLAHGSSWTGTQIAAAINSQVGGTANVSASYASGKLVISSTGTGGTSDTVTVGTFSTGDATSLGFATATETDHGTAGTAGLSGQTLTIGATGGGTATSITFGTTGTDVSTLNELNAALANNNLQATIDPTGVLTITTSNNAASATIGIVGGTSTTTGNAFAAVAGATGPAPTQDPNAQATRAGLITQYNNILKQIDTTSQDSSFNGVNLLEGDTLNLTFDETGKSTLAISGVTFNTAGLGLSTLNAGTDFLDSNSANKVLSSLNNVSTTLRSEASSLGSNLSIVQIRQDFSKNLINVLQTGASNLTLADTNEEAANSQALSTRQSIAVSALALANQSQQSVLQLLR
jgi:flagellin